MLLLEDNNDSFTYNIVEMLRQITDESIDVVKHNNIEISSLSKYSHIILSPGPGIPDNFPIIKAIIERYQDDIPILGICLGHQAVCEFYGGRLINLDHVVHGEPSVIECDSSSVLFRGIDEMTVGRYHSFVASDLSDTLKVVARSRGDNCIMAVEHISKMVFGVQFHPESYITENGASVLKNFLMTKQCKNSLI